MVEEAGARKPEQTTASKGGAEEETPSYKEAEEAPKQSEGLPGSTPGNPDTGGPRTPTTKVQVIALHTSLVGASASTSISLNNNTHVLCRFLESGTILSFWSDGFTIDAPTYTVEYNSSACDTVFCHGLSCSGRIVETLCLPDTEENLVEFVKNSLPESCKGRCRVVADILKDYGKFGVSAGAEVYDCGENVLQLLSGKTADQTSADSIYAKYLEKDAGMETEFTTQVEVKGYDVEFSFSNWSVVSTMVGDTTKTLAVSMVIDLAKMPGRPCSNEYTRDELLVWGKKYLALSNKKLKKLTAPAIRKEYDWTVINRPETALPIKVSPNQPQKLFTVVKVVTVTGQLLQRKPVAQN